MVTKDRPVGASVVTVPEFGVNVSVTPAGGAEFVTVPVVKV
jgi:hypothetical protein